MHSEFEHSISLASVLLISYSEFMARPSVYEYAGGDTAFQKLAAAMHERCLADPVLHHPFSHAKHPKHAERLGLYWAEAFGGPATYSTECGSQTSMLNSHARNQADKEFGERFVECFMKAVDDAELPTDQTFRAVIRAYMEWSVGIFNRYQPKDSVIPEGLAIPHWSWDGLHHGSDEGERDDQLLGR
jgi:hemoglobin